MKPRRWICFGSILCQSISIIRVLYAPIIYILAVLALGAGGYWVGQNRQILISSPAGVSVSPTPLAQTAADTTATGIDVTQQISRGERILIAAEKAGEPNPVFEQQKRLGVEAMAAGDFDTALLNFEAALQAYRNAPETRIYYNNARLAGGQAHTIAVSVPIAPDTTPYALEMLRGFAQAQTEINRAGGINGVPLELVIADDDDDPQIAPQVVKALAADPEILGVIGHWSSSTTLSVIPTYDAQQLVLLNPVSTSTAISGQSPYVFRAIANNAIVARTLVDHMFEVLSVQNAAVFYDPSSAYSDSLKTEFVTSVVTQGGQVLAEYDLGAAGFNVTEAISACINLGCEALFLVPAPETVDRALQVVTVNRGRLTLL